MILKTVGAILLFGSVAAAQSKQEQAVFEAERIGCLAYQHRDVEGVRAFLTDDYTLTDSHGAVTTKQDDLDDFLKDRIQYSTFINKNMKLRLYPGTAIVIGQTLVKGIAQGKPFDVEVQFTDTLVYLNGHWRLVMSPGSVMDQNNSGQFIVEHRCEL